MATLIGVQNQTRLQTKAKEAISRPLLLPVKSGEMLISFTTPVSTSAKIRYWAVSLPVKEFWISQTAQTQHSINLTNLQENTAYNFQIILVKPQLIESPILSFSTK